MSKNGNPLFFPVLILWGTCYLDGVAPVARKMVNLTNFMLVDNGGLNLLTVG